MLKIIKRYFNKKLLIALLIIISFLIGGFLLLKEQYYYEIVERFYYYPSEIAQKYYNSDLSRLFLDGFLMTFREPFLEKVFSSIYIYFATFSTTIFQVIKIALPIIVFYLIYTVIGSDVYGKFYSSVIFRIGRWKYILGHVVGSMLLGGVICVIPKAIYYGILKIFFVGGYSLDFFIENTNFVPENYYFSAFSGSPYLVLLKDFGISFLYGMVLALIAICIIMVVRSKYLSIISYLLVIIAQCVFSSVFIGWNQMIINCYSIFDFLEVHQNSEIMMIWTLIITILLALIGAIFMGYRKIRYEV